MFRKDSARRPADSQHVRRFSIAERAPEKYYVGDWPAPPYPGDIRPVVPPYPPLRSKVVEEMRQHQDIAVHTPVEHEEAKTCAQRVKKQMDEFLSLLQRLENADHRRTFKLDIDAESRGHLPEDLAKIHPFDLEDWLEGCSSSLAQLRRYMDDLRDSIANEARAKASEAAPRHSPSLSSNTSMPDWSSGSSSESEASASPLTPGYATPVRRQIAKGQYPWPMHNPPPIPQRTNVAWKLRRRAPASP